MVYSLAESRNLADPVKFRILIRKVGGGVGKGGDGEDPIKVMRSPTLTLSRSAADDKSSLSLGRT